MTTPLWYNKTLSVETFCISEWYSKWIYSISDVLDDNDHFRSLDMMKNLFNLRKIFFFALLERYL